MGDSASWDRLRVYASAEWGQAAASEDFQNVFGGPSMEEHKGGTRGGKDRGIAIAKNLGRLFDLWVYGIGLSPFIDASPSSTSNTSELRFDVCCPIRLSLRYEFVKRAAGMLILLQP